MTSNNRQLQFNKKITFFNSQQKLKDDVKAVILTEKDFCLITCL